MRLKILHIAPVSDVRYQGLYYAIPNLIRAQMRCGSEVALITTHPNEPYSAPEQFPVIHFSGSDKRGVLDRAFSSLGRVDLAVFHSTYIPVQARMARTLLCRNVSYVITPHGSMTRSAQHTKRWKKRMANFLFFSRMVRQCAALHFLSPGEARESAGWRRPSFVVGNGIELPSLPVRKSFRDLPLQLVFVGRLDIHIKGLDLLLEALALLAKRQGGATVKLRLFGPDREGSTRELRARIKRLEIESWVELPGPVFGPAKEQALLGAEAFVLTSRTEGHPISVLEALAHRLPCLLTPGTQMADEVEANGAGWAVEAEPASIAAGLEQILKEREWLGAKGERARSLAERHTWDAVGGETLQHYESLLMGCPLGVPAN